MNTNENTLHASGARTFDPRVDQYADMPVRYRLDLATKPVELTYVATTTLTSARATSWVVAPMPIDLAKELQPFADEALEWAEAGTALALETWPTD